MDPNTSGEREPLLGSVSLQESVDLVTEIFNEMSAAEIERKEEREREEERERRAELAAADTSQPHQSSRQSYRDQRAELLSIRSTTTSIHNATDQWSNADRVSINTADDDGYNYTAYPDDTHSFGSTARLPIVPMHRYEQRLARINPAAAPVRQAEKNSLLRDYTLAEKSTVELYSKLGSIHLKGHNNIINSHYYFSPMAGIPTIMLVYELQKALNDDQVVNKQYHHNNRDILLSHFGCLAYHAIALVISKSGEDDSASKMRLENLAQMLFLVANLVEKKSEEESKTCFSSGTRTLISPIYSEFASHFHKKFSELLNAAFGKKSSYTKAFKRTYRLPPKARNGEAPVYDRALGTDFARMMATQFQLEKTDRWWTIDFMPALGTGWLGFVKEKYNTAAKTPRCSDPFKATIGVIATSMTYTISMDHDQEITDSSGASLHDGYTKILKAILQTHAGENTTKLAKECLQKFMIPVVINLISVLQCSFKTRHESEFAFLDIKANARTQYDEARKASTGCFGCCSTPDDTKLMQLKEDYGDHGIFRNVPAGGNDMLKHVTKEAKKYK